jgi:hypothetical protein
MSEKLENQGGTFTWEDNSNYNYGFCHRWLYAGFGLGRTLFIGEFAPDEFYLDEFDGWFKDHGSASARFYYKLGALETPWTG